MQNLSRLYYCSSQHSNASYSTLLHTMQIFAILYTLHSSQVMLWGRQRAERLPCFILSLIPLTQSPWHWSSTCQSKYRHGPLQVRHFRPQGTNICEQGGKRDDGCIPERETNTDTTSRHLKCHFAVTIVGCLSVIIVVQLCWPVNDLFLPTAAC